MNDKSIDATEILEGTIRRIFFEIAYPRNAFTRNKCIAVLTKGMNDYSKYHSPDNISHLDIFLAGVIKTLISEFLNIEVEYGIIQTILDKTISIIDQERKYIWKTSTT